MTTNALVASSWREYAPAVQTATVILDPEMPGVSALVSERARLGVDRHDELWDGLLHMSPWPNPRHGAVDASVMLLIGPRGRRSGLVPVTGFNVGDLSHNYRAPDGGLLRTADLAGSDTSVDSAALVWEIVSPGDESWLKFDFYAAHNVAELVIVDPRTREVHWFRLVAGRYERTDRSLLVDLSTSELAAQIDWPPLAQLER